MNNFSINGKFYFSKRFCEVNNMAFSGLWEILPLINYQNPRCNGLDMSQNIGRTPLLVTDVVSPLIVLV